MQPDDYYCDEYALLNYTLLISSEAQSLSMIVNDSITRNTLSANAVYMLRVIASNVFGDVSTHNWTIICK